MLIFNKFDFGVFVADHDKFFAGAFVSTNNEFLPIALM